MILDLYRLGKEIVQDASKLFDNTRHSGKHYLGETVLCDSYNREWKIKVRRTGNRGRYLKIYSYPDYKQKLRASADKYKSYLQITSDEWEVFYRTAGGVKDSRARAILDKLVGI
ncbi:hypothetical protein [Nostoc sp.]|uniref:hypothetical protein n=1 Tax=Nostoc sp. TaxID=1180 RepID=UPI002FF7BADD